MAFKNHPLFPSKLFSIVALLAVGLVGSLYVMGQNTDYRQQASQVEDLNTSNPSLQTNNPDGTMGPARALQNFSNTLPDTSKGELHVKLAADKRTISPAPSRPGNSTKGKNEDKGNQGKNASDEAKNNKGGGPQDITSLKLTINKIEVHLAQRCDGPEATGTVNQTKGNGQGNGKWETIEIDGAEITVDVINLGDENLVERLGLGTLACGKYTELRLYITKAKATLTDGKEVDVNIAGKAGIIRIVRPFTINPNGATEVVITINPERSIIKAGDFYILKPVVGKFSAN